MTSDVNTALHAVLIDYSAVVCVVRNHQVCGPRGLCRGAVVGCRTENAERQTRRLCSGSAILHVSSGSRAASSTVACVGARHQWSAVARRLIAMSVTVCRWCCSSAKYM